MPRGISLVPLPCLLAMLWAGPGCFTYKNVHKDRDTQPVVMTGATATILYPGQNPATLPTLPPSASHSGSSHGRGPGSMTQQSSGSGGPVPGSGRTPVLLGGNDTQIQQHRRERVEPPWYNPFWFPVAVVLAPFRAARQVVDYVKGEPAPESLPGAAPAALPPPSASPESLQAAHEAERLRELERQLAQRAARGPASGAVSSPPATGPSIAEELAALRAGRAPGSAPRAARAEVQSPEASAPEAPAADRVEDRNGDGRPDYWSYRSQGALVRERFDDDGDGLPDRSIDYDPASGERVRVEEDLNRDRRTDAWSYYEQGTLVRRRVDRDGDGSVDAWTFYRDGSTLRHEEDRDGDGFRDLVDFYQEGRLVRREEDADGDGRPERITRFDASGDPEVVEEDRNGDGQVDVRSHYTHGRLARRELLTELARGAEALPSEASGASDARSEGP